MRKRLVTVGLVVLATAIAFVTRALADASGGTVPSPTRGYPKPPTPRATANGVTRSMTLGSYCWRQGTRGICADAVYRPPAHRLSLRAGQPIVIDFRIPARRIQASEASSCRGQPTAEFLDVSPGPRRGSRRFWVVHLPTHGLGCRTVLDVSAQFPQGDLSATIGIRTEQSPPGARGGH